MGVKGSYKLFFAIPFDSDSMSIYKKFIIPRLRRKYPGKNKLICTIGKQQIGAPEPYERIETFKMQNSQLFPLFDKKIRDADVIIADLTDNNPNVHVELGIALSQNKNILRVTRQSYEKLAFDVRGYDVDRYSGKKDLFNRINEYLEMFFKIKELDFKPKNSKNLYYHHPQKKALQYWRNAREKEKFNRNSCVYPLRLKQDDSDFKMRDGKVRVTFEIMDQKDKKDWFGVYLRVGNMGILSASILVYVRKNGQFGIVTYPRFKKLGTKRLRGECAGPKTLLIELEGDHIKANLGGIDLKCSDLDILSPGEVKFASHYCNSKLWDVQMVCRDTIGTFHVLSQ